MISNNEIPLKKRLIAVGIDYLVIIGFLVILFALFSIFYLVFLDGVPEYSSLESQLLATFTSVIPIIFIFTY